MKTPSKTNPSSRRKLLSNAPAARRPILAPLCLLALLSPVAAQGLWSSEDYLWAAGDSAWLTPGNWNRAILPAAGQETHIDNGGTARVTNATAESGLLIMGRFPNTGGSVVVGAGGDLTVGELYCGVDDGDGSMTVEDGGVLRVRADGYGKITLGYSGFESDGVLRIGNGGVPGRVYAWEIFGGYTNANGDRLQGTATVIFDHNSPKLTFTDDGRQVGEAIKLNGHLHVIHNAGVTELAGWNTYKGLTDLNGGTLVLNAVIGGDGTMSVQPGATLAGIGSYNGRIDARGTVAPGLMFSEYGENVTVGTLSCKDQTWRGGATFQCDMANATGVAGTGWDSVGSGRDLTIDATPESPVRIELRSLNGQVPGPAANFDGLNRGSWVIFTAGPTNVVHGFSPDKFVVDTTGFANPLRNGKFRVESSGREVRLIFTRPLLDVMTSDDPVVATSPNSPANEQAPKATDNSVETKYLNFDIIQHGFTVHVSGTQPVRALSLMSADDAPERDPASYRLQGSLDGVIFFPVASGPVPSFPERHSVLTIPFANETAYPIYRLTFPSVQNFLLANSVQIAEVELLTFGEITSAADTISTTLPPGGSFAQIPGTFTYSHAGQLFDHKLGTDNINDRTRFTINNATGGNTVVDIVPAAGATTLKGFELIGPSDAYIDQIYRPRSVTVAGSNDGINFTSLAVVTPALPTGNLQIQEYSTLANHTAYARYRITFGPPVSGDNLHVGELRLFGHTGTILTPLESWRLAHFGTSANTGDAVLTADPDTDQRTNLLEFATDGNPNSGSDDGKVVNGVTTIAGSNFLTLTLPVRTGATYTGAGEKVSDPVDGIIYRIQGSADLANWTATPVTEVTPALTSGMPALSAGWSYRTFRSDTGSRGFLRAVIEVAP